jgi:hypothetical protein
MLPQPFSLRSARRAWHDFYTLELSKAQKKRITRLVSQGPRAGQAQVVWLTTKPFSTGCKDTGALLIKRALDAVRQLRQVQFLQDGQEPQIPEGVVIEVNCVELGKKRSLSDRTMRTHITELMSAGLVLAKYFHGWRRNLELVISSTYLFKLVQNEEKVGPNNAALDSISGATEAQKGTKLPPIKGSCSSLNTTLTDQVEKWTSQEKEISAPSKSANAAPDEATPKWGNQGARGGAAATIAPKAAPEAITPQLQPEGEKAAFLATFSAELFNKAWQLLYPRQRFTAEQIERSQAAIAAGVYRHLDTSLLTMRQWQQYHVGCLERVRLAAKWFARHTDKTISWPYALYTNGLGYFDAENVNGFIRTEQWFIENEVKRHQRRVKDALASAETEFSQFKQLQRGLKITAPKRVKQFSAWELYRWHENRVKQFGGQAALQKFYQLVGSSQATTQPATA